MEEIIKMVEELILSDKREDGPNYYQLVSKSELSLSDESGNYNAIFREWCKDEGSLDYYCNFSNALIDRVIENVALPDWKMMYKDGLMLMYKSVANDLFYIQISDNNIHIHLHYSGQW